MFEKLKVATKAAALALKANSPAILLVGGIGLGIAATAVIVSKSEDAVKAIDELNDRLATIKEAEEAGVDFSTTELGSVRKAKLVARLEAAKKLAKTYAVAFALGLGSLACVLGAFGILNKQKAAIAGAYALLESKFDTYQERVREKFGAQADYDLVTGAKEEYVTETDADGKEVQVLKKTESDVLADWTARVWDETTSLHWDRNALLRRNNLINAKNYANDIYNARGYISLNEVLTMFGLEHDDTGVAAGWVKGYGDDVITCGIEDLSIEQVRRFMNPYEDEAPEEGIVLRFNCLADYRSAMREYKAKKREERRAYFDNRRLATC